MFNSVCKSLRRVAITWSTQNLHFLQHHALSSTLASTTVTLRSKSRTSSGDSFTVTYLVKSCGFSLEKAISASKYTKIETPDKPESVLAFFKKHGFTKIQISCLVRRLPPILSSDPEKTLLPKLEFFRSKGASTEDIAKILSTAPGIFKRSLRNQIIPSFNFLKNLLKSEEKTFVAIKRFPGILLYDLQTYVAPNIEALRKLGIPEPNIVVLLTYQPRVFMTNTDRFMETVEEVKKMGFNPERMKFSLAIHALRAMSKSTWEKKMEVYKKWGLSEEEVLVAFGKHPWCMMASEDKIMGVMDFLVNKVGLESSVIARRPGLVSLSLEKRIVPRCSVYQALLLKGLIKKDFGLASMLESPERWFLQKYVECHEKEAPELSELYVKKLNIAK